MQKKDKMMYQLNMLNKEQSTQTAELIIFIDYSTSWMMLKQIYTDSLEEEKNMGSMIYLILMPNIALQKRPCLS